MRQHILMALATAMLVALTIDTGSQQVRTLTLEEALAIADAQNYDIKKAEEYRKWVMGKYVEERAAALPQLSLTANYRRDSDSTMSSMTGGLFPVSQDTREGHFEVSQVLYAWGKVGAAIRAAKVGLESADEQLRVYRQAVRRDVSAAFYDVLLAKEFLQIALQNQEQKQRHLDEAKKKYELGIATDYDVLAAQVTVENARPESIVAENAVTNARQRLRFLLGKDSGEVDAAGELKADLEPPPGIDEVMACALKNRPDLLGQGMRVEVYRQLVKIAKAGDKPRLDLVGYWGRKQLLFGDYDFIGTNWSAGVYLRFPVFDGLGTRGRVMQSKSDMDTAALDEAKLKEAILLEARVALDAVVEGVEVVKALSGTEEQARRLLEMAEKGFEYGVKTRLEVQDAELNLRMAAGNLARARRHYLVSRVNLEWAKGTLGEGAGAGAQPQATAGTNGN